jgi:hypothetical protein
MLSLLPLFLGLLAMLGCWSLAWWVLKQPVATAAIEPRPRRSIWRNEPTLALGIPSASPIPSPRTHEDSDSNTQFFSRADLRRREALAEETEILHDHPPAPERTACLTSPYPLVLQAPSSDAPLRRRTAPDPDS